MLLLHLSDIHFREPDCTNPDLDPDRPYRTLMMQDARARTDTLGSVGAILIGGDIAFKGHPTEYSTALDWIRQFADACQCPLGRADVIPGNHDVDRTASIRQPAVRNAQDAIILAAAHSRERVLRTQFSDKDTGRSLLVPLTAYNDFAKLFSCQVYSPDHLYWKQDLPLKDGVHLRVYGLTSTLLSGVGGADEARGSLYLSPLQTVLDPVDDVVNLVLCHHPPDWFMDQDEINDAIVGRAAIHVFGHKHRQRITRAVGHICFSAGAVNPDRNELGWQPGYNLINVRVVGSGPQRVLEIDAHLLEWQAPDRFRAKQTPQGEPVFKHRIPIPGRPRPAKAEATQTKEATLAPVATPEAEADVEAAMSDESTRNLVFRFWSLSGSQRRDLALRLRLIEEADLKLPEPERYGRALLRAGEMGLVDELAREVERWRKNNGNCRTSADAFGLRSLARISRHRH